METFNFIPQNCIFKNPGTNGTEKLNIISTVDTAPIIQIKTDFLTLDDLSMISHGNSINQLGFSPN